MSYPKTDGYDFVILHPSPCHCFTNEVRDMHIAEEECSICWWPFGLNAPIVIDEGRLISHLSCVIEFRS